MIKKNEQSILEEFMRWRENEDPELANLKLEFFAHLQNSHPELISGLNRGFKCERSSQQVDFNQFC